MNRIHCGPLVIDKSAPLVMGILNITPDSFYDGGRYLLSADQIDRVSRMVEEGASIIDVGAVSTRPGAAAVDEEEELRRIVPALRTLTREFPQVLFSADTFRPAVARAAVEHGAGMINDIYGGRFHPQMIETVANLHVPLILMHMKGNPSDMQQNPQYQDVVSEVWYFFEQQLKKCREAGLTRVILDPGFGFGKTVSHNFSLLASLEKFHDLDYPILAGISRKSMINKVLGTIPASALNGTTVLNTIALMKGAAILRVHDVREAVEAVALVNEMHAALV